VHQRESFFLESWNGSWCLSLPSPQSLGPNGKKTEKSVRSGPVLVFLRTGPGPVLFFQNGLFGPRRTTPNGPFLVLLVLFWCFFNEFTPGPDSRTGKDRDRDRTGPDQKNSHTPGPDRTGPISKMASVPSSAKTPPKTPQKSSDE
jgi:hypothetical protein